MKEKIYIEERLSTPSVSLASLERVCGNHLMPPVEQADNKYIFPLGGLRLITLSALKWGKTLDPVWLKQKATVFPRLKFQS